MSNVMHKLLLNAWSDMCVITWGRRLGHCPSTFSLDLGSDLTSITKGVYGWMQEHCAANVLAQPNNGRLMVERAS